MRHAAVQARRPCWHNAGFRKSTSCKPHLPFGLAARTARIEPFHVMELVKRAAALQATGRPVIHMSIGEPDFTAPPPVIAALEQAAREGLTGYTPALGIEPLRQAIAGDYRERYGVEVDPHRIIVTAGASAALTLACTALLDPGDEVLLTDPSYPCNRHFIAACDGVPKPIPVGPRTRFQLTCDLLREHYPFSELAEKGANTLVFPNLASGNIAYKVLQEIGGAEVIGPVLMGMRKPVHILQLGSSIREIVNIVSIAVVDAQNYNNQHI